MVFLWKNLNPIYFVLTRNNFAIFHNLIVIDFFYHKNVSQRKAIGKGFSTLRSVITNEILLTNKL